METIKATHLTKDFGNLHAVDDFNLSVFEGEIFGLVGPDGAGKTTAMRLLSSIMEPTFGDAWIAGHHIVKEAETVKKEIGYMSQRFGLYPDLTVMENINFYADIYGIPRKGREKKVDDLLAFCNLIPFKKRLAGNLSGGMKQKLGLVCALVHTPRVLLLDEPTNGVDPVSRRDFWRILYRLLHERVTILVSTAYLDEAERCNRVGLIHKGKLFACGTPNEIKKLMHGTIIEIRSSESRKVLTLLRKQLQTDSIGLFGASVHVISQNPKETIAQAEKILTGAGIKPDRMRTIEPTLEDVFVSVLAKEKG